MVVLSSGTLEGPLRPWEPLSHKCDQCPYKTPEGTYMPFPPVRTQRMCHLWGTSPLQTPGLLVPAPWTSWPLEQGRVSFFCLLRYSIIAAGMGPGHRTCPDGYKLGVGEVMRTSALYVIYFHILWMLLQPTCGTTRAFWSTLPLGTGNSLGRFWTPKGHRGISNVLPGTRVQKTWKLSVMTTYQINWYRKNSSQLQTALSKQR